MLVCYRLFNQQIDVIDHQHDRYQQLAGVDIQVANHTIDVKANLNNGVFYIEINDLGWLFNPSKTSEIIVHVDISTDEIVWYYRSIAQSKIRSNNHRSLVRVDLGSYRNDFMHTSWDDLYTAVRS